MNGFHVRIGAMSSPKLVRVEFWWNTDLRDERIYDLTNFKEMIDMAATTLKWVGNQS